MGKHRYTEEELADIIIELKDRLGYSPTLMDVRSNYGDTSRLFEKYGGFNSFKRLIGMEVNPKHGQPHGGIAGEKNTINRRVRDYLDNNPSSVAEVRHALGFEPINISHLVGREGYDLMYVSHGKERIYFIRGQEDLVWERYGFDPKAGLERKLS